MDLVMVNNSNCDKSYNNRTLLENTIPTNNNTWDRKRIKRKIMLETGDKMKCKNQYCQGTSFIAVTEENQRLIGVKCWSCGTRYSSDELEIMVGVDREKSGWNSAKWRAN